VLLFVGCAVHLHGRGPREVVLEEVKVDQPPPAPPRVVAVRGVQPGPKHIWVAGHWVYRGNRYVWVRGRWVKRPKSHVVWVNGYWKRTRSGGVWVVGHWQ
jgi:hypothetical protein